MRLIRSLLIKYRDIILYLFFGVLTTLVNYLVFFPLYNVFHCSAVLSNCIAWGAAVIFAYLTNKPFVFKSRDWSSATVIPEITRFVGCRIGSGVLETVVIWLFADILGWNGNVIKLITSVAVVIINNVASKRFVFAKKENS